MTCDFLTQRNNGKCGSAVTYGPSCQTSSRHVNLTFTKNYHKQGWHRGYYPLGYPRLNLLSTWHEYTTYFRSCEWFMIKRRSFRETNIQALPEMLVVVVGVHHQLIKECHCVCSWAHLIPCLVCSNCCKTIHPTGQVRGFPAPSRLPVIFIHQLPFTKTLAAIKCAHWSDWKPCSLVLTPEPSLKNVSVKICSKQKRKTLPLYQSQA